MKNRERSIDKDIDFSIPTPGSWLMISVSLPHLNAALVSPPFPLGFTVAGYQTAEDSAAFFSGRLTLLDEVEEWLDDHLPGPRSIAARHDFHGRLHIAIPDDADAVMFKLTWSAVIVA